MYRVVRQVGGGVMGAQNKSCVHDHGGGREWRCGVGGGGREWWCGVGSGGVGVWGREWGCGVGSRGRGWG